MRSRKQIRRVVWLLAALFLSLVMGACGIGSIPCFAQQPAKTYRVPFRSAKGLIFLDTEVNDKPAVLLLDTGASQTIVSARLAAVTTPLKASPIGKEKEAVMTVVKFEPGYFAVRAVNMDIISKSLPVRIDGILGEDTLRKFSAVRINYKAQTVELESAQ